MGVKISELPNNSLPYTGSEEIPLIQSGETRAGTLSSFVNYLSGDLLADTELAALSGNWQNTYTSYSTNSATFVTYTGATQDVDLGSNNLTTTGYVSAGTAFAESLTANNFTALSATINVVDITEYELSGFSVSGAVAINGDLDLEGNTTLNGDLTVDTNTLHVDSSNNRVGIGTASPSYAFDQAGSAALGSGTLYVDSGGSVGIGTTSPSMALDVQNDANFGSSSSNYVYTRNLAVNDNAIISLGYLACSTFYDASEGAQWGSESSGDFTFNNSVNVSTDLSVTGDLTVDTNTLHVDSSNNRVGIGTTTPLSALDVNGPVKITGDTDTNSNAALAVYASDDTSRFEILDNGSWQSKNSGGTIKAVYDPAQYGGAGLLNLTGGRLWCSNILVPSGVMQFGTGGSNTSDISFNSNGAVAFKIEGTTGNLEIGTTNSITFADNSGSWDGATIGGAQTFASTVDVTGRLDANGGLQTSNITTAANSNNIDVSNGQMTSDTYFATSIDWNSGVLYDMTTGNVSVDYRNKELEHSGSVVASWGASGFNVSDDLSVTGNLTVDTNTLHVDSSNNNVGIGTTSPSSSYKLDVVGGNIRTQSAIDGNDLNLVIGGWITIEQGGGYVGIINSSPSYPLDVNGDVNLGSSSSHFVYTRNLVVADNATIGAGYLACSTFYDGGGSGQWGSESSGDFTFNGGVNISGQAEATNQAASTDDSLMTRSLVDTDRWLNSARLWSPLVIPSFTKTGTGSVSQTSAGDAWVSLQSGTSNSGYGKAVIGRGLNSAPGISGAGIYFSKPIGLSCNIAKFAASDESNRVRIIIGTGTGAPAAAGDDPISDDGFGVEIKRNATHTQWRVFAHNGTTLTATAFANLYSGTRLQPQTLAVYSNGSGTITAYYGNFGADSFSTISTTGGPTGTGASATSRAAIEVANSSSGTATAKANIYSCKFYTPDN